MPRKVILGLALSSLYQVSYAATVDVPASIDPSRAGQQLPTLATPLLQKTSPEIAGPKPPTFTPAKDAEKVNFVLQTVELTGNTVFTQAQLLPIYQPYLHQSISFVDLQKIAYAITLKYRNAGYLLSRAVLPAQVIDQQGKVKIHIIQGYVQTTGIQFVTPANKLIHQYGQALTQHRPLTTRTLERYTLLGNDIPGMMKLSAVVRPPEANAPAGATEVMFSPEFVRTTGFIGYDNRGTKYLGPNEFSIGGAVNSVLQAGDQWGMRGLISGNPKELKYANIYTRQPIAATGATFDISGTNSLTRPEYLLAPLKVSGHSQEVVTDIDVPWLRSRKQNLYTLLALDYLNNKTDINAFNINLYDDRIRSLRLAFNYFLQDKWAGANQSTLQVSHGLSIFNASDAQQINLSRIKGDPQYTKLNVAISRLQGINPQISFLLGGIAQYTNQPLLSAEQFAFGGNDFGQAYDPAEFTGDRGAALKAELRYNANPQWHYLNNIQYFAFYDIGKIWNVLPESQTGLPQQTSGASTGVGCRINFNQYIFATAEMAKPLTREVATNQSKAPRFFVSLTFTGKTSPSSETVSPGYGSGAATNGPVARNAFVSSNVH